MGDIHNITLFIRHVIHRLEKGINRKCTNILPLIAPSTKYIEKKLSPRKQGNEHVKKDVNKNYDAY